MAILERTSVQKQQDAYGKAMLDYLKGKRTPELAEIGCNTWFSEFDNWFRRERDAMRFVRGRVLDIGCGAGRHALYLQSQGYDVMAIDISPLAVEVCRRRGVCNAKVLPITKVSSGLGMFDTILMLGNNFGLMATRKRAVWMLRRFKAIATLDARILAGSGDPRKSKDREVLAEMERNRQRGRMPGQFRRRGYYGLYRTPLFDWLCVSESEIEELAETTGWYVSQFLRDETDAYVAVIERAAAT